MLIFWQIDNNFTFMFSSSELEKNSEGRVFAIMIAVATIIVKLFRLKTHPNLNSILEKHGSFMSKDKSMKSRLTSKPKKVHFFFIY
jgi:hypothetical protein